MSARRVGVFLFCMIGVVAATTGTASATQRLLGAPCPPPPVAQVYSQWYDDSAYTLVPGSTFESLSSGWSMSGGSVASAVTLPFGTLRGDASWQPTPTTRCC